MFTFNFFIESYETLNIENLGICEKGHKMKSNTNKIFEIKIDPLGENPAKGNIL